MSISTPQRQLIYCSATELAAMIAQEEVSAREVVEAHIRRIEEVDSKLNAVVVRRFERARREAEQIDAARGRKEPLGRLAGVPITVKECFHLEGTPSTIGIKHHAATVCREDGPLVARLRRAGAIVLGKTNVPQGMLMNETDNPVYGRTNNPWNLDRGPGGSSGGEAAILAAGGAALGLGNDVGGSIRQPAHSCGICGLKPTSGRLTNVGSFENVRGMEAIGIQPGPMARTTADVRLGYEILAAPGLNDVDWQIPPVSLHDAAPPAVEGMRIGYWTDDGYFPASAAVKRGVELAAQVLRDAGAVVEPFSPPAVEWGMGLYFGLLSADGGADLKTLLGKSPRDWRVRRLERLGGAPRPLRRPAALALSLLGQTHLAKLLASTGLRSGKEIWRLTWQRRQYVQQFMDQMVDAGLAALLMPPHALPALTHGSTTWLNTAGSYSMLINLLGCPAGVVPVTRVLPDEQDGRPKSHDLALATARQVDQGSVGLPIGVQVVARHWREDVVLAVMQALESALSGRPDYPARPPI